MTAPEVPSNWLGSKPEWSIFWALTSIGLKPDVDFTYQAPQMGGRTTKGGAVIDFLLPDYSLGINVQSIYWHLRTIPQRQQDVYVRAQMEGWGIRIIYIDEDDALRDPVYYVREALRGVDHSRR